MTTPNQILGLKTRPATYAAWVETGATIDTIGGNCPVQAEGFVDGKAFYFRARGQRWTFTVAETPAQIFEDDGLLFYLQRHYCEDRFDAGWMEIDEALGFITASIKAYRETVPAAERQEATA